MEILYFVLIILLLITNNNKIRYISFFLLLMLFAFNTGVADRENYELALQYLDSTSLEPGYAALYSLLSLKGLSIQWSYYICAPLLLFSVFNFITKYTNNKNYEVAIYMTCIFFLDIVQNRFSYASIFIYLAFYFLLWDEKKKSSFIFLTLILIATLFHSTSLAFLLFLLPKFINHNKLYKYVFVIGFFLIPFTLIISSKIGDIFGITSYMERLHSTNNYRGTNMVPICIILELLTFLMYSISSRNIPKVDDEKKRLCEMGQRIAITSLLFIPLYFISADFRRLFFIVFIVLTTISSNWILNIKNKLPMALQLVIVLLLFYYFSYAGDNSTTVINAIFTNNEILDILK